ncbi:MAG: VWA domain-containing protein [Candidatus Dormibacteria bacterium]
MSELPGLALARPLGLLGLLALVPAVWVWLRLPPPLAPARARVSLALRLALLVLLTLALAGLQLRGLPSDQALVLVVDRSASVTAATDQERAAATGLAALRPPRDSLGVVSFGRDTQVELPVGEVNFRDFETRPNANYTDAEAALRLASSMLPPDRRRHVVLVSDGRQNLGDMTAQARLLKSQGVRLDVLPVAIPAGPEVRVEGVDVPATVIPGARVTARVQLVSNTPTSGILRVTLDRQPVASQSVTIAAGSSEVAVLLPAAAPGFHDVHAELDPVLDTFAENNFGEALFQVLGPQRVLVVEGQPGGGRNVAAALEAAGIHADVVGAESVPHTAAELVGYQAVALVNVPADALGQERMAALSAAVRDLGLGLAAFAGPDSFGPGGYQGTPLEAALPVEMQISDRSSKPPVAVVLVLESMEDQGADAVMRGAAAAVVGKLAPHDLVGVTDSNSGLVVPLQEVGDGKKVTAAIHAISGFGDAVSYAPFIKVAADALSARAVATRHIVVVGDGDTNGNYSAQVAELAARGITVSAIGINVHNQASMMQEMAAIARDGKGRFYQSNDASQVPQLLLDETQKGLKPWIVEERFRPSLDAPSGALAGLDLATLPALDGYVAATAKAAAEVVMRSPHHDPVLAQWQYGLGHALAWTSDLNGRWSADLLKWPQGGRLIANMVQAVLPLTADPDLSVHTTISGDRGHVIAELRSAPPGAVAVASVLAPDLNGSQLGLASTAPGRYEGDFPADQVGSYLLDVRVQAPGQPVHRATAGLALAYSPEFAFLGVDSAALREVAGAGGGTVLKNLDGAWRLPLPAVSLYSELTFLLLALAAIMIPVDVAVRRLVLTSADAALFREAARRGHGLPVATEHTVDRLQERLRRRGLRERRPATGTSDPVPGVLPEVMESPPGSPAAAPTEDLAARLLARRKEKGGS